MVNFNREIIPCNQFETSAANIHHVVQIMPIYYSSIEADEQQQLFSGITSSRGSHFRIYVLEKFSMDCWK